MPPIPSQFVNESRIEAIVGNQITPPTTSSGTPTMTATVTRSPVERRTARFRRRAPPAPTLGAMSIAIASRSNVTGSRSEDRLLLLLDALHEAVDVVRVVQELLQRRDHHGRREVGPRVAVHVLRDVLRARDELRGLLLQRVVVRRARVLRRADVVGVGLQVDVLGCGAADEREERLRRR